MLDLRFLGGCKPKTTEARFDASYIPEPMCGCWLWLGAENGSNGYGRIKHNGRSMMAHRYSYERFVGQIPENALVCHRCDNSSCVNPSHLFLGSNQSNSDDKVTKKRQAKGDSLRAAQAANKSRGSRNGMARLSESDVLSIFASNDPQRKVALRHGITQTAVWAIKHQRAWAWLTSKK